MPDPDTDNASPGKRKRGRPKSVVIDLEKLEMLGTLGCPHRETASCVGVAVSTLEAYFKDPVYRNAYETGLYKTIRAIRSKQIELALRGDRTMLIWIGKQLLGQRDGTDVDITHSGSVGVTAAISVAALTRKEKRELLKKDRQLRQAKEARDAITENDTAHTDTPSPEEKPEQ